MKKELEKKEKEKPSFDLIKDILIKIKHYLTWYSCYLHNFMSK